MSNKLIPLVSIIIPTYNHAEFIGKALKSIINQTYQNWEAIIIDNKSTDHTNEILSKFTDKRINSYKIDNNGIIAKSRNFGIKLAKGEWIAFLDSDDWWTSDKLEICLKNIDEQVDFIYHNLEIINNESKFYFKRKNYKGRQLKKPILNDLLIGGISKGNAIGNSSVIVRKKMLIKIGGISENKNLVASEDYNTWLRIAEITDKFKYLNRTLGFYLIHKASAQKRNLSIPHREAVMDFMELFNNKEKLNLEVKLRYMSGNFNASNNNYVNAKKDFLFALKKGDINFKFRSLLKIIVIMFK